MISLANEFKIAEFSASSSPSTIEFTNVDVGSKFVVDGCDANVPYDFNHWTTRFTMFQCYWLKRG